jgi:hypothetical protein
MEEVDCRDLRLKGDCEREARLERTADRNSKLAEPREGGKQARSVWLLSYRGAAVFDLESGR